MSSPIHKFLFSPPASPPRQYKYKARQSPVPLVAGDESYQFNHYPYGTDNTIVLDTPSEPYAPAPGTYHNEPFSGLTSLKSILLDEISPLDASFARSIAPVPQRTLRTLPSCDAGLPTLMNTNDDAYLSTKVPTPVKHIFELGPSLPIGMSSRHPHASSHSRSQSRTSSTSSNLSVDGNATRHSRTHSRQISQSKRRPSIMVHVEDADFDYEGEYSSSGNGSGSGSEVDGEIDVDLDATPKAPCRSQFHSTSISGAPRMEPAPRKPSWRMPLSVPSPSVMPFTPQKSYADMQYHKRSISRPNVPSSPLPRTGQYGFGLARSLTRPQTIPRPLIRLLALALLAAGCWWMMAHSHAEVEGRLTFTGAHFRHHVTSEGEWVPRQARSDHMLARASNPLSTRLAQYRPLPPTHELLALQSYLLESTRNIIPTNVDTSKALDAHLLLPISLFSGGEPDARPTAGSSDSEPEGWLLELEREHADDIIIWQMDRTSETSSRVRKALEEVHGKKRHPAVIDLNTRGKAPAVLKRLGYPLDHQEGVLIVIGNEPLLASQILDMSKQELEGIMRAIGWAEEKKHTGKKKVLVQAQWKKKPALGGGHDEVAAENAKLRK